MNSNFSLKNMEKMIKTDVILIDNLKCGGCANSIKNALKKMEGVDKVFINHDDEAVSIVHSDRVNREQLTRALHVLGYPEKGTAEGFDKVLSNAKSYISCAIGRLEGEQAVA
jgi:copper chaperone